MTLTTEQHLINMVSSGRHLVLPSIFAALTNRVFWGDDYHYYLLEKK